MTLRILVTGGRDYGDRAFLFATMDRLHAERGISCIIEGGATGADALAKEWALARGVVLEEFVADWRANGRRAGPIRNRRMLTDGRPDDVVAFPGGRGTADMVRQAREAGIRVWGPTPDFRYHVSTATTAGMVTMKQLPCRLTTYEGEKGELV